jgi:hypothetical protein
MIIMVIIIVSVHHHRNRHGPVVDAMITNGCVFVKTLHS